MKSPARILAVAHVLIYSIASGGILNIHRGIDPAKFTFVPLTIEVRDTAGQLIPNGNLFCFGHDLGLIYPTLRGGRPLTNGAASIHLLRGDYTFIAYGKGFFVTERRDVSRNGTVTLQADTATTVSILDRSGKSIPGCFVGAVDARLKPLLPYFECGETGSQPCTIQVKRGSSVDFIVHRGFPNPSPQGTAFLLHFSDIPAGHQIAFPLDPSKLARLIVKVSAASGVACPGANLSIQMPYLTVEWTSPYIHRDANAPWQTLDLWATPERILISADSQPMAEWRFAMYPKILELQAGSNYVVRFGGRLQPKIWFLPEATWVAPGALGAQVWVDLADSHGGGLASVDCPKSLSIGNLIVTKPDGQVKEQVQLSSAGQGRISNYLALNYTMSLNLRTFGTYKLVGKCDHPTNLFTTVDGESKHFRLEVPSWSQDILPKFATSADAAYDALAEALSCRTKGKAQFHTLLKGGFASALHIYDSARCFRDPRFLTYPSVEFFSSFPHELGHVFQGASEGLSAQFYGPHAPHGEAYVAALAPIVSRKTLGEPYRYMHDLGPRSRFFYRLYRKAGYDGELEDPLDSQLDYHRYYFILVYLRDSLGPSVLAEFAQLWGDGLRQDALKNDCRDEGLNEAETICAFYSVAARQNLAWLFSLAGFSSSSAKVSAVLSRQTDRQPPTGPPRL